MSLFYTLAYTVGFKPWERAATREAGRIAAMFDREERERQPPHRSALDLGCGTGMQSIELARRGWQVTGIDIVSRAVRDARRRAHAAGVDVRFIDGDATALRAAGFGFGLVLDFGMFHGLDDAQRAAMGQEVTAVTAPGATLLMIAWAPGRRRPLPRGASRTDITAAFPAWTIIGEEALPASALPGRLKNVNPRIYRLRRN